MKPENTVEKIVSAITTLPYDPCKNERARMHQHDGTATPAADPGVWCYAVGGSGSNPKCYLRTP